MFRTIKEHHEDGLGLPYPVVLIEAAEEEIDPATGDVVGIHVPDIEGLAAAVALARVLTPTGLLPQEVKFLRDVLDLGSAEFAADLSMDPATYSRWENGKQQVGQWADKQVRLIVVAALRDRFPHFSVDPKEIVGMRPLCADPRQLAPLLRMRRRALPQHTDMDDEWDTLPLAA
ncbi:hypothetical protein AA101099_0758 [Neoasaia chiangmaiensis NBRC 101099]|uniref:Uncharacterized protein n=1 Tax=Neoasaia chiangmaiensis TaxID=320497 RepID=A0A1U9KMB0_9PROT|nr:hypothetical protein [Neoasaia chiangmaiensis]AQS86898.1 hypothetical protein A0U93_01860 [Neoasaia chiangmaiensis]GBR37518.1 hypothetical protein AA101099_0758 [Neoasaia chiangmaiensis NBRC 101099]GEN14992.1 hypothetical protein NCH01_14230 [Neoasaia chiangmaiensis]